MQTGPRAQSCDEGLGLTLSLMLVSTTHFTCGSTHGMHAKVTGGTAQEARHNPARPRVDACGRAQWACGLRGCRYVLNGQSAESVYLLHAL